MKEALLTFAGIIGVVAGVGTAYLLTAATIHTAEQYATEELPVEKSFLMRGVITKVDKERRVITFNSPSPYPGTDSRTYYIKLDEKTRFDTSLGVPSASKASIEEQIIGRIGKPVVLSVLLTNTLLYTNLVSVPSAL